MALDFPNSPTIGDEFTGGGFTWVWTGSSWDKVMASVAAGGNGFSLIVGSSGNTTYAFEDPQPVGAYSISSELGDTTFDIYLVTADDQNAGYANATSALEATAEFTRAVIYGATENDIINFEYKPAASPATSGDVDGGAAPFLTSGTPTALPSVDDTTTVTGGNFASNVEIVFTGQDDVDRAAKNIVRSSSTSLIVTRPDTFPVEQEPYTMTATNAGVPNPSVAVNKLIDYFDAGSGVVWVTSSPLPAYTTGVAYSTTLIATDADGLAVSYAVTAGTLPNGLSLNSSTGEISGTVTSIDDQTFTVTATDSGQNSSSREFLLAVVSVEVEYLVIAGGGGGGDNASFGGGGGGGGAGGYRSSILGEISGRNSAIESPAAVPLGLTRTVTVGAGGARNTGGSNSVFNSITSLAGGRGARPQFADWQDGGSGGGNSSGGDITTFGVGTAAQGFDGAAAESSGTTRRSGGGGGGAGGDGVAGTATPSGSGGLPLSSSVTGAAVLRGGGGGGGFNGAVGTTSGKGANNLGGGGNGQYTTNGWGGTINATPGDSGVVILRYPNTFTITIGAGLTGSTATVGANKVTTITAGTGNVSWAA